MQNIQSGTNMKIKSFQILLLAVYGLVTVTGKENSGIFDCPIPSDSDSDGGRFGYHSPSSTDTYLPNCQNPLN